MGQKKEVKLEDIAQKTGVSIVTVSNALKGKKGVSEKTKALIQKTAAQMGYQSTTAEREKESQTYLIGVVVAERYVKEFPSFYMDIYKRVAQDAARRGHLTVLEVVDEKKETLEQDFSAFADAQIAGIIVIGELGNGYIQAIMRQCGVPVVCVDYYDVYEDMDYIITDSFGGMEQMTEFLLKKGHENLMFVGTLNASGNIRDRYLGYSKALTKYGREESIGHILEDREPGYDYKVEVNLPEKLPDAFVCNCDKTASLLLGKLTRAGITVPDDVSVVGFDHFHSGEQKGIELTTYENDEKLLAQISVKTLLKRIEGKSGPQGVRMVQGRIIEGNTVKSKVVNKE